uniref:Putative secreted protein n=1 Tax=Anopheles triannulatus TaxID=58253 RepID=A0A2M4B1I4_9DIPT
MFPRGRYMLLLLLLLLLLLRQPNSYNDNKRSDLCLAELSRTRNFSTPRFRCKDSATSPALLPRGSCRLA